MQLIIIEELGIAETFTSLEKVEFKQEAEFIVIRLRELSTCKLCNLKSYHEST